MHDLLADIIEYDISILRLIHHNRLPQLDSFMYIVSFSTTFISIGLLFTVLVLSIRKKSNELRNQFYKFLFVFILSTAASMSLKYLIIRERPFVSYPDIEQLSEAGSSSFPSGHTTEAFAVAFAVSFIFTRKKFIVPAFTWAFFVAYSRMALGVHYPLDVVSGIIIGVLVSYLALMIIRINKIEAFISKLKLWKS